MVRFFATNPLGFRVEGGEIEDGAVDTLQLADLAVTTAKLAATAVTTAKITNLAITTALIAASAVTVPKISFSEDLPITNGSVLVDNEQGYKAEDNVGTSRNLICLNSSNQLNMGDVNGVANMRLSTTSDTNNITIQAGKVGIGVGVASDKLHVVGSIRMVDGNEGVGKHLVSDVNGKGVWTAAAGAAKALIVASSLDLISSDFTTTSTTLVDITDFTLDVVTTATSTIMMWPHLGTWMNAAQEQAIFEVSIAGTAAGGMHSGDGAGTSSNNLVTASCTGTRTGIASGTITCKVQMRVTASTGNVNNSGNGMLIQALEE